VRVTTRMNKLLDLPGIAVTGVAFGDRALLVDVRLRARRLTCPRCAFTTGARYDKRPAPSTWRHLDFGTQAVTVRAELRRIACPEHGVLVEAVPFARYHCGFTTDFEDTAAFLATKTDKTAIARFLRIDWKTVGRICGARRGRETRREPPRRPGHHRCGRGVLEDTPPLPDPGHRPRPQEDRVRPASSKAPAGRFEEPGEPHRRPAATLRKLRRRGGDVWRACRHKESFREIFNGDLDADDAEELIDRWISQASRSRLPAFVKAAKTIRKHRDGILTSIRLRINNGRAEGLNSLVRLIIRRAHGFHSPEAALALVMLTCGPIELRLPHEQSGP